MVTRLPPPDVDSEALVTALVADRQNGRNRDFFNGIADEWRQRVRRFLDVRAYPPDVPTWPEADADPGRFQNLYLSPLETQAQYAVLQGLRGHRLNHCPSCGEPGKPNTLDHYLPKSVYPHFSVEPFNLFPMCDACQGLKDVKIGDADHPRYFLHPYFDDFLDTEVLRVLFIPPYVTPLHQLEAHPGLPDDQASLVSKHIGELQLQRRYGPFFEEEHIRLLKGVADMRAHGLDVRQGLMTFALMARSSGPNTWNSLFYAGALADEALINWLVQGRLPAFVES